MTFCMKHLGSQNPPRLHTINCVTFFYKYLGYSTCKHPLILRLQRHSQSLFPQEVVSVLSLRHGHSQSLFPQEVVSVLSLTRPRRGQCRCCWKPHSSARKRPTWSRHSEPGASSTLTLTVTEPWNWSGYNRQIKLEQAPSGSVSEYGQSDLSAPCGIGGQELGSYSGALLCFPSIQITQ